MDQIATLEATIASAAERQAQRSARLAEIDAVLSAAQPSAPKDFLQLAALRTERDFTAAALERLADELQQASRTLAPLKERERERERQQEDDRALLTGLPDLFSDPTARDPDALVRSPITAMHRMAMEAADRLRGSGEPVPDAVTIIMRLDPMLPRQPDPMRLWLEQMNAEAAASAQARPADDDEDSAPLGML